MTNEEINLFFVHIYTTNCLFI